jgi:tight adherence protein B
MRRVTELWVITLLVFIAALFGVVATYWLVFDARSTQKSISRRLALGAQLANPSEILDTLRRERGIIDHQIPALRGINDFIIQTGLRLDAKWLILSAFALSAALFVLFGLMTRYGPVSLCAAVISALALMLLYFRAVRRRRIARFAEQLPDAIDVIVRGMRVGYALSVAFDLVAREMPDPVGTEFGMTADEISFGQDIKTAMENLYRRVGQEDLQFLIVAVNVQTQTGGNLADILLRLSRLIRSRAKVALKIRALSAEGRASAKFLTLMPFILVGIISLVSPAFFAEVRNSQAIEPAVIYAAVSLLIGNIVMYRMVNFKF